MRKIGVYCDMCGCNVSHDACQRLILGQSRCVDLCMSCYTKIEGEIINLLDHIESEKNSRT